MNKPEGFKAYLRKLRTEGKKRCPRCEVVKPFNDFYKNRCNTDGYTSRCRDCMKEHAKATNEARVRRNYFLRLEKDYGLTLDGYNALLDKQGNKCSICGGGPKGRTKNRLSVDHDHKTGRVRGLLCNPCNIAIGLLSDCPELLNRAREYLDAGS